SADHLTVQAAVQSSGAGVTLSAGDDFSVSSTGSVSAGTTVVINIDAGDADAGTGATAVLDGPISSGSGATLNGNADADSVTVNRLGTGGLTIGLAGSGDTVTVNLGAGVGAAIQSVIAVLDAGSSGTDQLYVTGGETLSDSFVIDATQVQRNATETVTYDGNLEELYVSGLNETGSTGDTFTVTPSTTMKIFIDGDNPASVTPGDKLVFLTPAGQTATQTVNGPDSGTIDATGGYQQVTYTEIESLAFGGDVVINGTGDDDHMIVTATGEDSGSYVVWTDFGSGFVAGPTVGFAGLTKLTFNGLAGDDVLTIAYDPAATQFLNPQSGVFFNGGSQVNDGNALTPIDADLRGDTLQVFAPAGETADTITHRLDPASVPADGNNGLITIADASGMSDGSTTIVYSGLEPVLDAMPAVDRVFDFTAGAETVTLSAPGDGGLANWIGSDLSEKTSFNNPSGSLTVDVIPAGHTAGADAVSVEGLDGAFDADLTITGGGDDSLTFQTAPTDIGSGDLEAEAGSIAFAATFSTTGNTTLTALTAAISNSTPGTADVVADDLAAGALTGIDLDTTVATIVAVVSGDGTIQIDETDDVTLTSVTTANGSITVNAGGQIAAVSVGSGGGAGDVVRLYTTAGDIVVGVITSADTASLETDSGSIVDDADDTATDITAAALITLTATANIHGPGPGDDRLDLAAGSLVDASSETAGAIRLRGAGALVLQDVDTANGPINVLAAGQITATDVQSMTDNDANDIILQATSGDILVALVSAGATAGDVWLAAAGAIEETATDGTADIVGQDLEMIASLGIGGLAEFQIDAVNLAATTTTGDINLHDTAGGLTIASLNVDGIGSPTDGVSLAGGSVGDDISIRASDAVAASPLTVNAPVSNTGGGEIRLAAEGNLATDDLTVNANVTATGGDGNIRLYAGDSISLAATVTVGAAGAGAVLLSAGSDYNNNAPQDGNSGGDVS
ncbi:MAG TPA: hypothetical protein PLF81_28830, partial [Candidatus Anammoximicrobium sp.]|nr:hypothetical protein [Candidatus Anammoximicrobium sp.]